MSSNSAQQKYWQKLGLTEVKSAANHCSASVSADGRLISSKCYLHQNNFKSADVPGRRKSISPAFANTRSLIATKNEKL